MYKIGELAALANVSKRTIDYYTNLGLLEAKRSPSNYRYYTEEALSELTFIESCKSLHIPLEEIKRKLECKRNKEVEKEVVMNQATLLTTQLEQVNKELSSIMPIIHKLDDEEKQQVTKQLSLQSDTLLQSLRLLLV
ncbi:MerR family transcriptional regulator [Bacillus sp. CGMCC 1.16541]|uniref:MerR family transcriptional regulator n=1 Tax=Bacillus sp. CGMCC 1.16541 TaxID=2185143 RepID=UPI000D7332DF|nr:MerR family transcriptional regulator [Bacillus sp. CGMCC 1.16541]